MPQPHFLIEDVHVGFQRAIGRVVTEDDLRATMAVTGDHGGYHTDTDFARAAGFQGVILPGMFTAGLVTRLGGELNLLAREMTFRFDKPVYVGDTVTCKFTVTAVQPERRRIEVSCEVTNQRGELVLTSTGYGYLPAREWGIPRKPPLP
jgi:3-hydroxybutyryl-CoA dehydratase